MIYRRIYTKLWKQDAWFLDLAPEEKLLFIYLFSNECASIAGIYELSDRVMAFETGLPLERVRSALQSFAEAGKAYYRDGVVWVCNLRKYNESSSSKVQTRIRSDVDVVPDCELKAAYIRYHETGDTLSIPYTYADNNDNDNESDNEVQEAAAPPFPANLDTWISLLKDPPDGTNRTAVLHDMGGALWPDYPTPPYSDFGAAAKYVKGAERLAQLMWQANAQRVTGDYLAYCRAMHKRNGKSDGITTLQENLETIANWEAPQ